MTIENIKYWTGNKLTRLNTKNNDVFVFGSNPLLSFKKKYP